MSVLQCRSASFSFRFVSFHLFADKQHGFDLLFQGQRSGSPDVEKTSAKRLVSIVRSITRSPAGSGAPCGSGANCKLGSGSVYCRGLRLSSDGRIRVGTRRRHFFLLLKSSPLSMQEVSQLIVQMFVCSYVCMACQSIHNTCVKCD